MDNNDQSLANTQAHNAPIAEPLPHTNTTVAAPVARPAGNSALTTGLVILVVALLFVLLILSLNGNNGLFTKGASEPKEDLTALQARNAQLRSDANAARIAQGLPVLPEGADSAQGMADRLQRDSTSLAALITQWEKELILKDTEIRKLENDLAARAQNSQQLYGQIAELQKRLAAAGNAGSQVISLQNDLKIARNQAEILRKQLAEYQARPSSDQHAELNRQLMASIERVKKLELQIDGLLESSKNNIDRSKYNEIVSELEKLRPLVNTQRYEIQRLRALLDRNSLFIDSYKELPTQAIALFERLRGLEDTNPQQLASAYQSIGTALNARVVHRQEFAEGSSQVPFAREALIREAITQGKGSESFYLVVGYASKTGNNASNRELSAKRATTVASMVNTLKESGQQVKAVYLGETKRFSASENAANQICEVWEIK